MGGLGHSRRHVLQVIGLGAVSLGMLNRMVLGQRAQKPPNILLAISDDQSYPYASAYGYPTLHTPAFDRIAREGVLFTNAFTASSGCSPARAALLTGRNPWQLEHAGTHASAFPAHYITYPDVLEKAGYVVGYTGKGWAPGNFLVSGRHRNPAGPEYNTRQSRLPFSGIKDIDYAANFCDFLRARPQGKPFCFWYGAHEPHRPFAPGIGVHHGKKIADVVVPPFLPDTLEVRSDILDYCVEIEWFNLHLARMLRCLEAAGELEQTLIVVTSDNGMAFPRAKANLYEYGIHMPLAIRWGAQVRGGRVLDDLVSLIDLAPTFLEAAGVEHPSQQSGNYPMAGQSLLDLLLTDTQGVVDPSRTAVYAARERHSSARYQNLGYPQRCVRTQQYLYIRNFTPDRWPVGDPQPYEHDQRLGFIHGGYADIDDSPTLRFLIDNRHHETLGRFFRLAVAKRPGEELYDITYDPGCLHNLTSDPALAAAQQWLVALLERYLRDTQDPRIVGNGEVFETYQRHLFMREFPSPQAEDRSGPQ
jgi:uncharacterized sulfatase